jgi:hypothetical protein
MGLVPTVFLSAEIGIKIDETAQDKKVRRPGFIGYMRRLKWVAQSDRSNRIFACMRAE